MRAPPAFMGFRRQGLKTMFFCVLKDELFMPEDELCWADGQM